MENSNAIRIILYGFIVILGIHSGVQILSSALELPLSLFASYEYLPWTRIIGLFIELVLTTIFLLRIEQIKSFAFDKKKMVILIISSSTLFVGAYYKYHLEVPLTFCATGDYESYIQELSSAQSKQWFVVNLIESIILGLYILIASLMALKSRLIK